MARQYGTNLGAAWMAVLALGAVSGMSPGQQSNPAAPPYPPDSTNLCLTASSCTMDEWDERLLNLLDLIWMFLGLGLESQTASPRGDIQAEVDSFIAAAAGAGIPSNRTSGEVSEALDNVKEARLIAGTYSSLPPAQAAELDRVLGELEAGLHEASASPTGESR